MAILAIHTDGFKLLILAISSENLGDAFLDTTASRVRSQPTLGNPPRVPI